MVEHASLVLGQDAEPLKMHREKRYVHFVHSCILGKICLTNKGPAKLSPHLEKAKSSDSLYSGKSNGGGVGSGLTFSFQHIKTLVNKRLDYLPSSANVIPLLQLCQGILDHTIHNIVVAISDDQFGNVMPF